MLRNAASILPRCVVAAALLCAFFPGVANASPAWLFNGVEWGKGKENVVGDAVLGSFSIPSLELEIVCKKTHYEMAISNSGTMGLASMNWLGFTTCTATGPCTIEAIEAEGFPWSSHLQTVSGEPYFIVEKVKIMVPLDGVGCALEGISMPITGTAGSLYDNPTETFAFSPATFAKTKTKLVAFGSLAVEWSAAFTTEAEFHKGETLTVG